LDAAILEMIAMMMLPTLGREPGADLCRGHADQRDAQVAKALTLDVV
jgi:hypothetical protein